MPDGDARWVCCGEMWPGPHALGCNGSSYVATSPTFSPAPMDRIATAAERIATALDRIAAALDAEREGGSDG